MKPVDDTPPGVDERAERLICRLLDGEISFEEQAELDETLAGNPAARALLDEYRQIDAWSADALRRDFRGAVTAAAPRRRSGLWLATAGGLLAAAAVLALSFLSDLWPGAVRPDPRAPTQMAAGRSDSVVSPGMNPAPQGFRSGTHVTGPQFADYRNADQRPVRRLRDVQRDWIGIPSADMKTILILERKAQATTITPISGDF